MAKEIGHPPGSEIRNSAQDGVVLSESVTMRNGVQLSTDHFSPRVAVSGLAGLGPTVLDALLNIDMDLGEFSLKRHYGPSQTVRADGSQTLRSWSSRVLDCGPKGELEARDQSEVDHPWGVSDPVIGLQECAVKESEDGVFAFANSLSDDGAWNGSGQSEIVPYLTRANLGLERGQMLSGPTEPQTPVYINLVGEILEDGARGWAVSNDDQAISPSVQRMIDKVVDES